MVFDLLNQFFQKKNEIQTNTANTILNLELPFLENVDIAKLMSIRLQHGEEFQNFRVHLDKQLRELRLVEDPEELQIKAENAFHELSEVQIQAINQKMSQMRRSAGLLDGIVLMSSLSTAISTGSLTTLGLSAAAVTIARGLKSFVDYDNQIKQNPAFFLWKVLEESN